FTYRAWRTGDERTAQSAAFWTRIFAVNFVAGVVTGIPMEFQFGTNWAAFSAKAGSVVGQPLAMEGLYAFFLESVFLGILLFGRERVSPALYTASAACVWLGSWLSGYFIVVTDAWMQHPVGYALLPDGRIEMTSLWSVLNSKFAIWQYAHVIAAALTAGGFIVAGVGAFYLLARRDEGYGHRFLRVGVPVALVASLAVLGAGDLNGADVTEFQPIKLAAMEGLFESTRNAPLAIIGMPDVANRKLIDPIVVPGMLSALAYGDFSAGVKGLTAYATELWPPVELTYYAYHIMVGLGTIFIGVTALAAFLLFRKKLFSNRPMLWLLMLSMPFPYIANEAGWVVTEVGRQPWIIYGLMRTAKGVSPNVAGGEMVFTLIGFIAMYFLIGVLFLYLTLREIGLGPDEHATPLEKLAASVHA
ncbi:MAG TPA: cytochrome ubiquinol oxidase subunit I, partial [Candidatus Baltobacteraceae bacterium]|nr:cytochrome ubiquinol oxidase subunit I [Candidatus Baltobacteraceae bacterium]